MSKTITNHAGGELDVCADCGQTSPTWASVNHGTLICDQCAIVHRSLGRFVSQVKPLRSAHWRPTQLQMVLDLYRSGSNSIWEHTLLDPHMLSGSGGKSFGHGQYPRKKPTPSDPLHPNKSDFIRSKYQSFAYVNKSHGMKDEVESEADISEQLHSSVRTPNLKTSLRLLVAGANPNYIHSEKFNSPLHMAARSGQMSQIELLLIYGANLAVLDAQGKSAIDYAREAGHCEIVYRLIEHQFDLPDTLTRFICQGRQPNHRNGEHFLIVDIKADFLNMLDSSLASHHPHNESSDTNHRPTELFRNELHQSIQSLSHKSFQELARDIYDEIDRREINAFVVAFYANENGKLSILHQQLTIPFLPVYQFFSTTRNQGRQKLALLNTKEFTLLIVDVLNEIRRRVYGYNQTRSDEYTNVTRTMNEFDDDDSEPLYDSVPSEEDYDECNEMFSPTMPRPVMSDGRASANTLVTSSNSANALPKDKSFVSMSDYSMLKEQMLKSTNLMEEFLNENKEMRLEIARLQGIVEKLVEENVQLRQLIIPSKQNSSSSLNNEILATKSNSVLLDSSQEQLSLNRNSFLRGSGRVRPQSMSNYSNSSGTNNRYSNEGISMKSPSSVVQHSNLSPSKSSNSSLLNYQAGSVGATNQNNNSSQLSMPLPFVNSSNSSSSSLSSQPQVLLGAVPHQSGSSLYSGQQAQQHQVLLSTYEMNNLKHYQVPSQSAAPLASQQHPPLSKSSSLSSASPLPTKDEVIKRIECITNGIKEMLARAREGKHDEFRLCSERICNYVSDMINLFPESIESSKIDNQLQINQALIALQTNVLRLHEECHSYDQSSLGLYTSGQDFRFVYNSVIDKAADVANSVKMIINLYSQQTADRLPAADRFG